MFRTTCLSLLLVIPTLCCSVYAEELSNIQLQKAMIQDLETAKHHMDIKYAPIEWKKNLFGWDLEDSFEKAKAEILSIDGITQKNYRKILKQFFKSTRDYHVNIRFYSTEWSVTPVSIKGINGRYFITHFLDFSERDVGLNDWLFYEPETLSATENTPSSKIPTLPNVQMGDELIAINGIHPQELIEKYIDEELGGDRTLTGYAIAEKKLFCRFARNGDTIPQKPLILTVKMKGEEEPVTFSMPWLGAKEWVKDPILKHPTNHHSMDSIFSLLPNESKRLAAMNHFAMKDYSVEMAKDLKLANAIMKNPKLIYSLQKDNDDESEDDDDDDSRQKGFLPPLGTVIWENDSEQKIYAYLFQTSSGSKIGYLRIDTFSFMDQEANKMMEDIMDALKVFNEHSSALVLDTTDNGGGLLYYMYGILSTLVDDQDHPFVVPIERQIVTPEDAYYAAVELKLEKLEQMIAQAGEAFKGQTEPEEEKPIHGFPINKFYKQQNTRYFQQIIKSHETGEALSAPLYCLGIDKIYPHPKVQYKKPIIVLVNEMDFSCADFFPAILQDNKRAVIFGTRTAGAGGSVHRYTYPSRFGLNVITLTGSIAYRPDGTTLENLGVTPDVPYSITERDIRENYKDYIQAVNETIDQVLK